MKRTCDGYDSARTRVLPAEAFVPAAAALAAPSAPGDETVTICCNCGLEFSDGERSPVYPHQPAGGQPVPPRCLHCLDTGHVCEGHPQFPWEGLAGPVEGHNCQAAGMPCPWCCPPVPEDGTHSIAEAFIPDWDAGRPSDRLSQPAAQERR